MLVLKSGFVLEFGNQSSRARAWYSVDSIDSIPPLNLNQNKTVNQSPIFQNSLFSS